MIGLIAAFGYAIYGPAIFNELEVEKTALATFFLLAAVILLLRKNSKAAFFGGIVLALGVLCRGNILALVVPLGLYLLLREKRWDGRGMLFFLAGCCLILLPMLWRNHYVGGEYVLTASIGQNLYKETIRTTRAETTARCHSCARRQSSKRSTTASRPRPASGRS